MRSPRTGKKLTLLGHVVNISGVAERKRQGSGRPIQLPSGFSPFYAELRCASQHWAK